MSRDDGNSKNAINSRTVSNSKFDRNHRNAIATPWMSAIPGRPATVTHQEIKRPATVWMPATAVTPQATTIAPATINSKDYSNIMTTHNSRNASKQQEWKRQQDRHHSTDDSRNAVKIRDDNSIRDNSIIMDVISIRTAKIGNRDDSNIQQGCQKY
jgi:hypothetical protein